MDWLVVILVVTALAMIGVISLIHRGRVRIWSICMILLGLGIGILLYTQISIFKNWQTALYIVFSVVLALVLVYLFVTLGARRQQKSAKADKNPEENDVLTTASREPMRLSDWEAVISYSAAPAKANKEIHRVNADKPPEAPAPVSFSSVAFTASEKSDSTENEGLAADAITSFFRENTQLPASAIRMDAAVRPNAVNGKVEERKTYPEPIRVSPAAKPAAEPTVEKEDEEAFESLSFRVVRDKFADSQKKPEPAIEPKTAVTKDAPATDKEKDAPPPVYKVHKKATAPKEQAPDVLDNAPEQDEAISPVLLTPDSDVSKEAVADDIPMQPVLEEQVSQAAFAEETPVPVPEELQDAMPQPMVSEEPLAEPAQEPKETVASPAAIDLVEEPVFDTHASAVEEPEPVQATEQVEEFEPVIEPIREEISSVAAELPGPVSEPEPLAEIVQPAVEQDEPSLPERDLQAEFEAGMAKLNVLIAAKEYRNAQALIFDQLRMEYEPTEEEKRRLLLVMKLLKEKEKTADARNR